MKTFIAYFNNFTLELTEEIINLICRSGDNTEDVSRCLELDEVKSQIKQLNPDDIIYELKELGAWDDEELKDLEENEKRLLWVSAWNIYEEDYDK